MPFLDKQGLAYLWDRITANIRKEINNIPTITPDEEIIDMLAEEDTLPAVVDSDGAILADENKNILLW